MSGGAQSKEPLDLIDIVRDHVAGHAHWLKESTDLRLVGESVEITTPYLDRHSDDLQTYAKQVNGEFVLSGGYTLDDLAMSGCDVGNPEFQALLQRTLTVSASSPAMASSRSPPVTATSPSASTT